MRIEAAPHLAMFFGGYIHCMPFVCYSGVIRNDSCGSYSAFKWLSIALDVTGLFCLYCFLERKPIFTHSFWVVFSIIYTIKSAIGLAILASAAIHTIWDGSNFSHIVLTDIALAILDMPFFIAIILYTFDSDGIWSIHRNGKANA